MTLTLTLLAALALLWYCWPSPDGVIDRYYQVDQQHLGYVNQHQRHQNLIGVEPGFQKRGNCSPSHPAENASKQHRGEQELSLIHI